ncbi:MAG: helix-turn-helix domain-containing protein [Streptosporangiaceae bacterium]
MTRRLRPADLAEAARVIADLRSGAARAQRQAAGISAARLAAAIGVSRQAASSWETAGVVPTVEHALAYGRALAALAKHAA